VPTGGVDNQILGSPSRKRKGKHLDNRNWGYLGHRMTMQKPVREKSYSSAWESEKIRTTAASFSSRAGEREGEAIRKKRVGAVGFGCQPGVFLSGSVKYCRAVGKEKGFIREEGEGEGKIKLRGGR